MAVSLLSLCVCTHFMSLSFVCYFYDSISVHLTHHRLIKLKSTRESIFNLQIFIILTSNCYHNLLNSVLYMRWAITVLLFIHTKMQMRSDTSVRIASMGLNGMKGRKHFHSQHEMRDSLFNAH